MHMSRDVTAKGNADSESLPDKYNSGMLITKNASFFS